MFRCGCILISLGILFLTPILSIKFSGKILSKIEEKPIEFANIILLKFKKKVRTNANGEFNLDIDKAGSYKIIIRADGYKVKQFTLNLQQDIKKNYFLESTLIKGNTLFVRDKTNKQVLGRQTLKIEDLKNIPASFGDALGAATILPGINRANGFLGSLVLRGVGNIGNRFFIDGIPVLNPQHFGGIQFIISNDIIKSFDIYASSAPVNFGQIYGGTISIDTVDDIKESKGVVDISLLYASFYYQGVLKKKQIDSDGNEIEKKWGYWIASTRIGYLGWTVLPIIRAATNDNNIPLPQYVDYQFKFKFLLDDKAKHGVSLLLFGTYDFLDIAQERNETDIVKELTENGNNPYLAGANDIENQLVSNVQSMNYTFKPSDKLTNKLYTYNVINYSINKIQAPILEKQLGLEGTSTTNIPNVFAVNNKLNWDIYKSFILLDFNVGYDLYYFKTDGRILRPTRPITSNGGPPTPAEFATFEPADINIDTTNHLLHTSIAFEFKYAGFFSNIGIRLEYLLLNDQFIYSPRGLLGYEFVSETTIAAAAGIYNSFPQINFFYLNSPFSSRVQIAESEKTKAETSYQFSLGIDQKFFTYYSIKIEGFYNILSNLLDGAFTNSESGRNYGAEFLIKKDAQKGKKVDYYAWLSYTYSKAERKNSQSDGQFIPFNQDQEHTLKITTGIEYKQNSTIKHEFGIRFELSTGNPYTPIIGSAQDNINLFGTDYTYYNPIYGKSNSQNFPIQHRLDFRYTINKQFKKFKFSFYVEIINLYYLQANNNQRWLYNKPFGSDNPIFNNSIGIPIIPSFGFEFSF